MGDTSNVTFADPVMLAGEVIVTQFTPDEAVHGHPPLEARTSTLPVPPDAPMDADVADRSRWHSAAACVRSMR